MKSLELHPLAQVVVSVAINVKDGITSIEYHYIDPQTRAPNTDPSICKVKASAPYHTVYALDYPTSKAGWFFDEYVQPSANGPSIPYQRAANRLAMTTMYETLVQDIDYRFYLLFRNSFTNQVWYDDPQESNSTPP